MGLPSYNNYVELCVFFFVKTKEYYYFVSYHFMVIKDIYMGSWYVAESKMHIIFMLQIVMWITILSLYHYALFIESIHDLYWFGFGIGKYAVKPI